MKAFFEIDVLSRLKSEKGIKNPKKNGINWEKDSIFRLIADLGKETDFESHIGKPSFMVCDDMNTEIADFILVYENNAGDDKVVFIHAKSSSKNHKYSATAIQEVCSQATKNIRFLNPYNISEPPNISRWDNKWKSKGLEVKNRIRLEPGLKSGNAWKRIENIIKDPLSNKEVWLVINNTLSKSSLISELKKSTYEAIQATILIQSTNQCIGTVNGRLKVFCSK